MLHFSVLSQRLKILRPQLLSWPPPSVTTFHLFQKSSYLCSCLCFKLVQLDPSHFFKLSILCILDVIQLRLAQG